jgi:dolichyl-diphosphooligosaccharide--protein glycosyltransferase
MVSASAVRDLLDGRPDLEPAVEAVLAADDPFTLDDLDIDSGPFGELVDAGIVESVDGGYAVTNRQAVTRALAGDVSEDTERRVPLSLPAAEPRLLAALGVAISFVVVLRLLALPNVFQSNAVVLSGNDPYFYRYWVERLLTDPAVSPLNMQEFSTGGEPLTLTTLWAISVVFGGTKTVAGWVLAWYPIGSAIVTSLLLYRLAVETTHDRRIGLVSVVMLAVIPGHATRTSLGFADHHAFDYPWLVLTALALVVLVDATRRSPRARLGALALGVGVAGQTLAWSAGPLLLAPVGVVVLAQAVFAVRDDASPARRLEATLTGLGLGAAVVVFAHLVLGWHTRVVALSPAVLFVASTGVVGAATAGRAYDLSWRVVLGGLVATGTVALVALSLGLPGFWNAIMDSVFGRLLLFGGSGESQGVSDVPIKWVMLFGLGLVVTAPYLGWATVKQVADTRWTVPVAYGWYFLVLAMIQIRFVGEAAPFVALFAGLGLCHLCERLGVARRPVPLGGDGPLRRLSVPDTTSLVIVIVLLSVVTVPGMLQIPGATDEVAIPEEQYRTADWMADYSAHHDMSYPDNYVLSTWSWNRLYNYFVNGESRSYRYALERYDRFLRSDQPERFYQRNHDRVGFLVYGGDFSRSGDVERALAAYGSRNGGAEGLQHYRTVYVSENADYKLFRLVEGATITGTAAPEAVLTLRSEQRVDGWSFTYERRVTTDADGEYRITVPYPGEYRVNGTRVRVAEQAVETGGTVPVGQ